jgi:hypothetical protein
LDLVEAPTFFSTGVMSAKVLLQVVSVATLTAISYFHFVHFLSCSTFMCFFFCTHVITQTQDIMTGVLVGNDAKETNTQKYKGGKEKESLQKGCLKINETGKKAGNQKLLPYKMISKNAF